VSSPRQDRVNALDRLRQAPPGLFERDGIRVVASSCIEAGMTAQALALFESGLRHHPRSGKAAVAVAEACLKTGDRAKARRHFELALEAAEEKADAAITSRRLDCVAAPGGAHRRRGGRERSVVLGREEERPGAHRQGERDRLGRLTLRLALQRTIEPSPLLVTLRFARCRP
jgi:tetratricopeptide (TPR) repeat protein